MCPVTDPKDDFMICTICGTSAYMAEATHYDKSKNCVVLCCWTCRNHHAWKVEARGLITIEEWFVQNKMTSKKTGKLVSSYDDWLSDRDEDQTQPGGFVTDPNFNKKKYAP